MLSRAYTYSKYIHVGQKPKKKQKKNTLLNAQYSQMQIGNDGINSMPINT